MPAWQFMGQLKTNTQHSIRRWLVVTHSCIALYRNISMGKADVYSADCERHGSKGRHVNTEVSNWKFVSFSDTIH